MLYGCDGKKHLKSICKVPCFTVSKVNTHIQNLEGLAKKARPLLEASIDDDDDDDAQDGQILAELERAQHT